MSREELYELVEAELIAWTGDPKRWRDEPILDVATHLVDTYLTEPPVQVGEEPQSGVPGRLRFHPGVMLFTTDEEEPVLTVWSLECEECGAFKSEGQGFQPYWCWHKETCSRWDPDGGLDATGELPHSSLQPEPQSGDPAGSLRGKYEELEAKVTDIYLQLERLNETPAEEPKICGAPPPGRLTEAAPCNLPTPHDGAHTSDDPDRHGWGHHKWDTPIPRSAFKPTYEHLGDGISVTWDCGCRALAIGATGQICAIGCIENHPCEDCNNDHLDW